MANNNDKIWNRSLDDIMSESFGKYAKYIIQDRALPDVRDGLKPVQRRILHAMNELKIFYDSAYKKSARTVGEVIGKYHPHGDSSIYEAMVRMAQEWKNNMPLIDMQGNKGSIDGDSPAAMRYTECRLSKFGQTLLKDINKNTVKFINNFDDSEQEPTVLPSLIPNILINGATGIAAGYATNIPPFNPGEIIDGTITRILKPECSLSDIAKIIKGPDFPTGGIIQGKEFIDEIYKTGKGKFFIRAKIEEEPVRSNKNIRRLVVKEIPFDTNKAAIVRSLDEIKFNNELPGFKEVRDDSDKEGIAIVLEFETEKDLDIIKTFLFKKTQLQISYNANMVLIKNRKPVQASLLEILDSFIEHANDVVIKAAQFDLDKSLARKEIIEGLIKAISDIDILVDLIKSSVSKEEAKIKIQNQFDVNERQSEAIVNLRLYILTSYDTEKLKKEYEDLLEFIKEKEMIINSSEYRNKHIIQILEDYKKQFAYKRKTLIENEVEDLDVETADIVEEIHGTCIVTRDNYIKFIGEDIEEFDLSKTKIKDADIPVDMFKMSTLDYLVCLTNRGKVITIPAYKIKMSKLKDNGVHINELITIDSFEKTILAFAVSKNANIDTQILIATRNSFIKRITLEDLSLARTAKYLSLISLKTSDDEVVSAYVLKPEHKELISVTENGFATKYDIEEIPIVGRAASGVKNMSLKDKDCIGFVVPIPKNENFLFFVSNRGAKRIHINDIVLTSRSKLGKRIFQQTESNPYLVNSGFVVSGRNTIYLLLENNEIVPLKVSEIPISDNESRMNLITKIGKNLIVSSSCLDIEKSIIELSQTNNFNTLSEEKQNRIETKEKETSVKENEEEKESKTFSKPKKSYFINEDSLELEEKSNEEEYENDIEENQHQELDENKQEESKNYFIVSEQTNLEDDEVKEDYK
ncbi:MAG: DNA topoisomerase IV subunit A, partial [Malacoplasma sp.]|nr:DNA topoisomerase IV subunit A [Malacoplasma sp.]